MTEYWKKQMNHELTKGYFDALVEIIKELKPVDVLEIGTGWGVSGSAFMDAKVRTLTTIDPNVNNGYGIEGRTEIETRKTEETTLMFVEGKSEVVMADLIKSQGKYDFIFIDGDHSYEAVKKDLEMSIQLLKEGGHIVMDDYLHEANYIHDRRNCGVAKAVREYLSSNHKKAIIWPHNKENGFLII